MYMYSVLASMLGQASHRSTRSCGQAKGVCLGQKTSNESSCSIVSEGAGTDEKHGTYFAWPHTHVRVRNMIGHRNKQTKETLAHSVNMQR